jgi:hypothetical protein
VIRPCLLSLICLLLVSSCAGIDGRERPPVGPASNGPRILIMIKDTRVTHYHPGQDFAAAYGWTGRTAARRAAEAVADEHGLRLVDEYPMPSLGLRCFVAEIPVARLPDRVIEALNADARVEWAQPIQEFRLLNYSGPSRALKMRARTLHLNDTATLQERAANDVALADPSGD